MHSPKLILLPLVALSLLSSALAAEPLSTICSNSSGTYSSGDSYDLNLLRATASLALKAPPTGFATASAGRPAGSAVYALALCRGDLPPASCKSCVAAAAKKLRRACPTQKSAIAWLDACLLRYSDSKFFGTVDGANKAYVRNTEGEVTSPKLYNLEIVGLLERAAAKAYSGGGAAKKKTFFGTEEMEMMVDARKETVYAMAQCTGDLSAGECRRCLEAIMGDYRYCCNTKRGGRVLTGSCNFRYELYPFYKSTGSN